ncbi:hypothetical protein C8F01DRAFT_989073 [Mycena amicta]|nr:hypothetical protein C8F01DRAFT_989073 [Mycena amicta]
MPLAPPSQPGLGRRPARYRPTLVDFKAYVQRRNEFLLSSRGCVALLHGGIVARLARLVIPDFEDKACLKPSNDDLNVGAHIVINDEHGALWYEALTPDEIDLICGVYPTETGDGQQLKYISWWPLPGAFRSSGLDTGWWNDNCERWFQKRLDLILKNTAELHTGHEWKSKIRYNSQARKITTKLDEISAQYLATRPHVDQL